ncbi:MAG: hypothetical protein D6685_03720 [Bacteroidetes bacterium]|nr:hypothetical protein AWN76_009885 [Rhodothermaceae bacterium RA]RMH67341.1 MAG: hypothetical protein D6685_03720 [Bacteroidota bacterium]
MSSPRNIARIDIDSRNTHGWQVRITRHRVRHTKFFSDSRYGGSEGALEAAIAYRDEQIKLLPDPLPGAKLAAQARSTSGVPGIRLTLDRGIARVEADAVTSEGKRQVRTFSLRRWGLRKALWKACTWKASIIAPVVQSSEVNRMYETAYPRMRKQLDDMKVTESGEPFSEAEAAEHSAESAAEEKD